MIQETLLLGGEISGLEIQDLGYSDDYCIGFDTATLCSRDDHEASGDEAWHGTRGLRHRRVFGIEYVVRNHLVSFIQLDWSVFTHSSKSVFLSVLFELCVVCWPGRGLVTRNQPSHENQGIKDKEKASTVKLWLSCAWPLAMCCHF